MEAQALYNLLLGCGLAVGGWFARTLYALVRQLEVDLTNHKVEVARDYATNTDIAEIKKDLAEILRYMRK